jgi:hypothetical protein
LETGKIATLREIDVPNMMIPPTTMRTPDSTNIIMATRIGVADIAIPEEEYSWALCREVAQSLYTMSPGSQNFEY